VVINDGVITYATSKGKPPKSAMDLSTIKFKPHPKKQAVITIEKPDGHRFFFKCQNIQDKVDWLKALEAGLDISKSKNEVVINQSALGVSRSRGYTVRPDDKKGLDKEESKGIQIDEIVEEVNSDDDGFVKINSPNQVTHFLIDEQ
jgi:hypothetical protein